MGWDLTPDALDNAFEKGTELVGDGVEWAGNKTADGLDKVGWESGADAVRDTSRSAANYLGADVAEMRLGETEDPKKLIYGSVSRIRSTVKHLKDFQSAFEKVGNGLKALDSSHWKGEAADAFREEVSVKPKEWFKAADACKKAAGALEDFAGTVSWAQGQAQDAIDAYKAAKTASENARSAHNDKVDAYNTAAEAYNAKVDDGKHPGKKPTKPGDFHDPGAAKAKAAQEKLDEARRQRDEAVVAARKAVKDAKDAAPPKPSYGDQLGDGLKGLQLDATHLSGGVLKGGAGILGFARGLNPFDPYNLTHPAEYFTGLNNTAAGLHTVASNPAKAFGQMMGDFRRDPTEATGRLLPDLLGTKGAGRFKEAARLGKEGRRVGKARGATKDRGPGENTTPSDKKTCDGTDPVDLATGKMFLPQTDVSLPGALPLVFRRQVESGYRVGRWFGPSWSSTADQRLEIDAEGVIFVSEDGLLLSYPHPAPDVPTFPETGPRWPLERDPHGDYTVTDPATGRIRHFNGPRDVDPGGDGIAPLEQVSDRSGHWITFEYDGEGAPTAIAHSAGYELKLSTAEGRITALHLAGAAEDGGDQELIRYTYTDGNLTGVAGSSGLPLRFEYDEERRVIAWSDTNDRRYDYVYDHRDRCIAEGGEAGHISLHISYDEVDRATGHRVTKVTTPEGHTTRYFINDAGKVAAETNPLGHTTRTGYDRYDRVLSRTDALGRTTAFVYDEAGHLTRITAPDGSESTATYDGLGQPTSITGPDGATWTQTYDEAGRRTSATDAAGHTTHYAYDSYGHLSSVTNALDETTLVRCDKAGLPVEITDPLGAVTRYDRDAFGRPVTITDALGSTTHLTWTVEGKLTRRTNPDGSTETWTYDGEGNCTTHTDAIGATTTFEYTHFDLLAARTGPDGVRYEFDHDPSLRLTQVTNPQGLTWSYEYDPAGRLTAETDFDDRTVTYEHDAAAQLVRRTNPLGQTVAYAHNPLGQITRKTAEDQMTTLTYDPAGRLTAATGPDTEVIYQHDRLGRIKSEMVNGRVLAHSYDPLGRRTRRVTPTGAITTYTYDAAGNRTSLTAGGHTLASEHDATGRETTRRIGGTLTIANTWDPLGRLTEQSLTGASDASPIQHRAYTYRADGNVTAVSDHLSGRRSFDLDATGRVTTVRANGWTETYAYDEAGNQTQATWPAPHPTEATGERTYTGTRITRAGNLRYEHDDAGRLTLRQKTRLSKKPDTWHYTWDAEDHLTSVTTPDGTLWRYLYDPFGRRTTKQRLAADGETVLEQTDFTWDGPTLVEQTTTTPNLPHPVTLTWDHDGLRPIAQTERITEATTQREIDARFFAIITDLVGTPTELVDESGTIAWHTRATLWGTTTWAANSTAYTPLRFPGQYFDPETGLHYNFHRYYDPDSARYLSPDPLGLTPAPNPATYVHNPCTWTDVLGLAPDCDEAALGYRDHGTRELADAKGIKHFLDLHPEIWRGPVQDAIKDGSIKLHVNMKGFSGGFEGMAHRGLGHEKGVAPHATEEEMGWIARAVAHGRRDWDSITWYDRFGEEIKVPEPDWANFGRVRDFID